MHVDGKTVRISAYLDSSTRDPRAANERSGTRLKTESETGERLSPHTPYGRVRLARFALKTLTPRFTYFFTDFEKKTTVLQSIMHASPFFLLACRTCICKNICSRHTRVYIPSRRPFILLTQIKNLIILSA